MRSKCRKTFTLCVWRTYGLRMTQTCCCDLLILHEYFRIRQFWVTLDSMTIGYESRRLEIDKILINQFCSLFLAFSLSKSSSLATRILFLIHTPTFSLEASVTNSNTERSRFTNISNVGCRHREAFTSLCSPIASDWKTSHSKCQRVVQWNTTKKEKKQMKKKKKSLMRLSCVEWENSRGSELTQI